MAKTSFYCCNTLTLPTRKILYLFHRMSQKERFHKRGRFENNVQRNWIFPILMLVIDVSIDDPSAPTFPKCWWTPLLSAWPVPMDASLSISSDTPQIINGLQENFWNQRWLSQLYNIANTRKWFYSFITKYKMVATVLFFSPRDGNHCTTLSKCSYGRQDKTTIRIGRTKLISHTTKIAPETLRY